MSVLGHKYDVSLPLINIWSYIQSNTAIQLTSDIFIHLHVAATSRRTYEYMVILATTAALKFNHAHIIFIMNCA